MGGPKRGKPLVDSHVERQQDSPAEGVGTVAVVEPSPEAKQAFRDLSKLLGEQAVKCVLRRHNEATKKWDYQDTFPAEEFSFEMVRDVFGGGEYQVQALDDAGDYVKAFSFHVDARYKGKKWIEQSQLGAAPDGNGHGNGGGDAAMVVLVRGMLEELKAMRAAPAVALPAPPDPIAMIKGLAEAAKAMMPPPPPAPAPPPQPTSLKDQLDMIKSVVEVGTTILDARGGNEVESGDVYTTMVAKLADPVVEMVKDRMAVERGVKRAALPAPAPAAGAAPAPAAGPAPVAPGDTTVVPPWVLEVRRLLPIIASRATRGISAENTAFFVLDDLSDAAKEKIAALAARDDFEQQVMTLLPQVVRQKPEWAQEFCDAVRDYFYPPEDEPEDEEGGGEGGDDGEGGGEPEDLDARATRAIDAAPPSVQTPAPGPGPVPGQ